PVEDTVANTRAGTIKACRRAKLAPSTGGQIVKLWVKEGERVKKGQPLLELWNVDLAAETDLARRQVATAREQQKQACIVAANARRDAERTRQLAGKGFVSPQSVDNAESQARSSAAACDTASAQIRQAQAQIDVAKAGMARTFLSAPFAGVVARITGELGEFTTPSPPGIPTPPAVDLIDDSCLYVSTPMDEIDAPKIQVGMPARITLDALPGKVFKGRVRRIAPYVLEVEKQARTVDVETDFIEESPDIQRLLAGFSADAEVIIERKEKVLRIPTQALIEGKRVWLVGADNKLVERTVKTGLSNWSYTEIKDGLSSGDRIVTTLDREGLKAGAAVSIEPEK
ncbi:MAG: efflux RND transporter periplasmic adaptor subunit, partial [Thiobacillaceae bacterium]